jgi:hypothetical protein
MIPMRPTPPHTIITPIKDTTETAVKNFQQKGGWGFSEPEREQKLRFVSYVTTVYQTQRLFSLE